MNIQWYPGHMKKALRAMQEDLKLIDIAIEIMDARIPISSRNPDIDNLFRDKARILILNKSDLADKNVTKAWHEYFESKGIFVVEGDARDKRILKAFAPVVEKASLKKKERDLKRGIKNRPVRSMVVGVPNSGKSTFINTYAGKASTKTGNKPGVTRGKQWIRLSKGHELLDTPGILWPKFEDEKVGLHLAYVGSIRDEILGKEELAKRLVEEVEYKYPGAVGGHYGLEEYSDVYEFMEKAAIKRGCLKAKAEPDLLRVSDLLIDDFRNGRWGNISLERVEDD